MYDIIKLILNVGNYPGDLQFMYYQNQCTLLTMPIFYTMY